MVRKLGMHASANLFKFPSTLIVAYFIISKLCHFYFFFILICKQPILLVFLKYKAFEFVDQLLIFLEISASYFLPFLHYRYYMIFF